MKKNIIIGSRGSILALAQANLVKSSLEANYPDLTFEIKEIVTSGDKDLKSNWENSNASLKSFFTKEIEQELLDGQIDIAVHSMKDMPAVSPKGLICGAIPDREDARDVLISKNGFLVTLPQGAKIGTSSLRRVMNLKAIRPDFEIKHLRGNIHTRLKKLETEDYDAIILAAAGLKRTGMADKITEYLSGEAFPPAPAQGVLYIQCRENDEEIKGILKSIHNEDIAKIVEIEREFSKIFDGGCHTPMGCYSQVDGDKIKFIEKLAESMNENKIESVKYEDNNFEVSLTKKKKERNVIFGSPIAQPAVASNITQEAEVQEVEDSAPVQQVAPEEISGTKITSPMVGTFYGSPSPAAGPFVKEGDSVTEGQTLCIVEAMKLMNEVKSTVSGKVKKIFVKDNESIKKGQTLMIIE